MREQLDQQEMTSMVMSPSVARRLALTIAFIMRFIPLGFGAVSPSILRISGELDRAARIAGASWLRTMASILFPLLRPALLSGYVLLFISS